MKKLLLRKTFKQTFLAVPAAALMLGAGENAYGQSQIGINFFGQGDYYGNTNVTATAFGVDPANWFTTPFGGAGVGYNGQSGTNIIASLPAGAGLTLNWSSSDTWNSGIGGNGGNPAAPTPGNAEITWGYLDDGSPGYSVTISGLRGFASSYAVQTIAASDNATGFGNVNLATNNVLSELLNYTNSPAQFTAVGNAGYGTSTVSAVYSTLNGYDSITLTGAPRNGAIRSTLAGIILSYTPGNNAPLIGTQPQSVTNNLFPGNLFSLSATASGTPALTYQWQQNGTAISGATNLTYSKTAVTGDSGNYTLVVNNNYGSVTSLVAVVTVQNVIAPVITQAPVTESVYPGYPATFSVTATGGQLTYQWYFNNVAITGATNTSYSLAGITVTNAGTYTVGVNNPVGPVANASAALTVKVPAAGSYEGAMAQTQPSIWYRYSETGTVLQDTAVNSGSLGSAGNGLYQNVTHAVTGAIVASSDKAASFNGTSSFVKVPYQAQLNPTVFSAEAWVKPAVATTASPCVFCSVDAANPRAGWLIYQGSTGWDLRTYNQNGITISMEIVGGGAPVAGNWYHLVIAYDGTTLTFYVNGVSVGTAVNTGGLYVPATSGAFTIGGRSDGAFIWGGVVDEAVIYGTALTASQVLAHYQNGTNASPSQTYSSLIAAANPVEYLKLDEPAFTGTVANNSGTAGPAWNGTVTDAGGIVGQPQIALGQAGPLPPTYPGFETTNRAVTMTNGYTSSPVYPLSNSVTVVSWVYAPNASGNTAGDLSWICWLGDQGQSGFYIGGSDNQLHYQWVNDPNSYDFTSGLIVPAQTWTFTAMVVTPTQATLYMSSGSNLLSAVQTLNHATLNSTEPVAFGGDQPGSATRTFVGQLDESAVYNRALSSSEISTLFLTGTGAPYRVGLVPGGIIPDTKPVGTPHNGSNSGATWLSSSVSGGSEYAGLNAGQTLTRTGVEQFVETNNSQIAIPADPDFNGTNGTISFWMLYNLPATLPGSGTEGVMLFDRRVSNTNGAVIVLNAATGNIEFQSANGARFTNSDVNAYVADANWHHVAITYGQTTNDSVILYVDGVQYNVVANPGNWTWPTTQEIELGRSHDSYWYVYDGQLDDVRIYNRILTPTEIATIATANTSDQLIDTNALKLRFNFDNVGIGQTVTWPFGTLLSSPVLGAGAVWTPVANAVAPNYPILPTQPAQFFRATP